MSCPGREVLGVAVEILVCLWCFVHIMCWSAWLGGWGLAPGSGQRAGGSKRRVIPLSEDSGGFEGRVEFLAASLYLSL